MKTLVDAPDRRLGIESAPRVLLAEDSLDDQRMLGAYLTQAGLSVTVAQNGREAVEFALGRDFDLVLMDVRMPVMDGVAATTLLRAAGFAQPIVVLAADVMTDDVQRCRDAGCNGVLAGPIDRERLHAAVTEHMTRVDARAGFDDPNDMAEMAELTAAFRAGLPAQIDAIRSALRRGDRLALKSLIHNLKGTAGSYGFGRLTELAAGVDAELVAGRHDRAGMLCEGLLNEADEGLSRSSSR